MMLLLDTSPVLIQTIVYSTISHVANDGGGGGGAGSGGGGSGGVG